MPVTDRFEEDKFFVKTDQGRSATPLFIVLLVIETTDFVFAVDSIPAVLAITTDPFIVYTSNVFAMLGLRALYFAVAGFVRLFRYLHYGFSIILVFVGVKMFLSDLVDIPAVMALAVVASVLSVSVIASFATPLEEEIKSLMQGGTEAGIFHKAEPEMVAGVFDLGDWRVSQLMTPRSEITWLDIHDNPQEIRRKMTESGLSRFPVAREDLANILGVVEAKDLLIRALAGESVDLNASLQQPLRVPESTPALKVLESFKGSGTDIALVVDEHGSLKGLLTHHDILEVIVGDIPSDAELSEPQATQRNGGSRLLDGNLPLEDFKGLFHLEKLPGEEKRESQTLAGFVATQMGHIPSAGERFEWNNLRFEVMDMDGNRVDKVLVVPVQTGSSDQTNSA